MEPVLLRSLRKIGFATFLGVSGMGWGQRTRSVLLEPPLGKSDGRDFAGELSDMGD